jgi:thioredoxin reductase
MAVSEGRRPVTFGPPGAELRAVVVVPARDEEQRIGACLDALAAQVEVDPAAYETIVVLDACEDGTEREVEADALFVMIGAQPRTEWLPDEVERDDHGFIRTGVELDIVAEGRWPLERPPCPFETSIPGVFAVGDVRAGSIKRVATSVGEGSNVISQVQRTLAERTRAAP